MAASLAASCGGGSSNAPDAGTAGASGAGEPPSGIAATAPGPTDPVDGPAGASPAGAATGGDEIVTPADPPQDPTQQDPPPQDSPEILGPVLDADVPVFPGAEGFGTFTAAGRGGSVCKVTTLRDDGPGSLRRCAQGVGPRTIVFDTGGTIELESAIRIEHPHVSIFGQTAPGDGILLRGSPGSTDAPLEIATHDVLVQHLRLRAGNSTESTCCRDSLSVGDPDAPVHHVVLDHLSLSWGVDEIAELWFDTHHVTFSRSIFAEGLHDSGSNREGAAGRGLLIGSEGAHSISLHHNFFAHSYQRNPMIKAPGVVDVTNNLVYHWVSRGGGAQSDFGPTRVNFVKNRWIAQPDRGDETQRTTVDWGDVTLEQTEHELRVHFEGNLGYHRTNQDQPQWRLAHIDRDTPYDPTLGWHVEARHAAPPVTEMPAAGLETELPLDVGATLPRQDEVDLRLFAELRDRLGAMPDCVESGERDGAGEGTPCRTFTAGWPSMDPGLPRSDADNDGMPDDWERASGTDPERFDARDDPDGNGYTHLEEWVQSIR